MEWISFFGPRRPINGQKVYYFGEYIGVWQGRYEIHKDDPVSEHILICEESPGIVDRIDAPWWMPYEGQPKPKRPTTDYPKDYPQQVACDACGGSGQFCVGETLVSRDMAIDAECPSMEGTHYEYEFARCPTCGGDGWVVLG